MLNTCEYNGNKEVEVVALKLSLVYVGRGELCDNYVKCLPFCLEDLTLKYASTEFYLNICTPVSDAPRITVDLTTKQLFLTRLYY